jgi:hypothetical protein
MKKIPYLAHFFVKTQKIIFNVPPSTPQILFCVLPQTASKSEILNNLYEYF